MSTKNYPDIHYRPFRTDIPRNFQQTNSDTEGMLIPESEGNRFSTVPYKPDVSDSTVEDPINPRRFAGIDPSEVRLETELRHSVSEPDLDDVLEPLSCSRSSHLFLRDAWKDRPLRNPGLEASQARADIVNKEYIKVLRNGGEFSMTYKSKKDLRVHVRVSEDLTQLLWNIPRKKKVRELNVFEIFSVKLEDSVVVLGKELSMQTIRLSVLEENTVDRLVETKKLNSLQEKAKYWALAFEKLVRMKLQSRIYK